MGNGKTLLNFDHGGDRTGELLDFSANISPLGVPGPVRAALTELVAGEDLARYPDPAAWHLCRRVAITEGIEPKLTLKPTFLEPEDYVVCGNGASDLIYRAVLAVRPQKALIVEPTFSDYRKALQLTGCDVASYPLTADNAFDLTEDFLHALTPDLDMVFLCAPNNPTGRNVPADLLEAAAKACAKNDTVLFWDASFLDFTADREGARALTQRLVRKYENVLVLKSFTKLYALPGVRLGYLLSSDQKRLSAILTAGAPWSVSTVAQTAGVAALKCEDYVAEVRELIAREKAEMIAGLEELGFAPAPSDSRRLYVPSDANFLLLRTERADLVAALEDCGIKVRDCRSFDGLDGNWIRVAVRSGSDNKKLLSALKGVL